MVNYNFPAMDQYEAKINRVFTACAIMHTFFDNAGCRLHGTGLEIQFRNMGKFIAVHGLRDCFTGFNENLQKIGGNMIAKTKICNYTLPDRVTIIKLTYGSVHENMMKHGSFMELVGDPKCCMCGTRLGSDGYFVEDEYLENAVKCGALAVTHHDGATENVTKVWMCGSCIYSACDNIKGHHCTSIFHRGYDTMTKFNKNLNQKIKIGLKNDYLGILKLVDGDDGSTEPGQ